MNERRFVAIDYGTGDSVTVRAVITVTEAGRILIKRIQASDLNEVVPVSVERPEAPPILKGSDFGEAVPERKKSWRQQQRELPKFLR